MEIEDFVQTIIDEPDNDNHRLVLADFLEERGDPRAEMIRLQFQLKEMDRSDSKRAKLRTRELKLLRTHGGFGSIPKGVKIRQWHGGFIDEIELTLARFMSLGDEIFSSSPVRSVILTANTKRFKKMLNLKFLPKLQRVIFKNNHLPDEELAEFLKLPALKNIRELSVRNQDSGNLIVETICEMPHFENLDALEVSGMSVDDNAALAITNSTTLGPLTSLQLGQAITEIGTEAIAKCQNLGNLKFLELHGRFGFVGIEHLHDSTFRETLESTELLFNGWASQFVSRDAPMSSPDNAFHAVNPLPRLKSLSIGHELTDQVLMNIAKHYETLESLDLSNNALTDRGVETLADSPLLANLKRFVLTQNGVTLRGVDSLVSSEHWSGKTKLYLTGNNIDRQGRAMLREKYGKTFGNLAQDWAFP